MALAPIDLWPAGHVQNAISLFFIAAVIYYAYRVWSNSTSKIPGPWYTRWTSLVLSYKWLAGKRALYVHGLHQTYGRAVRIGPNEISVTDMEAVKTIYSTKETFLKAQFYRDLTGQPLPSLFSTSDVHIHRRLRRLLAGQMSESSLKALVPKVDARVKQCIQRMEEEMRSRGAADVFKWSLFMATDVIGELTFGESFKMLDHGEKNKYAADLESVAQVGAIRSTFPTLVSLAWRFPIPIIRRAVNASRSFVSYGLQSLKRYESIISSDPDRAQETLFTRIFKGQEEEKVSFQEILISAQGYIVAGSDTTANSLTYLIWSVCQQSQIRDTLTKELQTLPPDFTEQELRQLPYLNHVIDETLRLYSAAPSSLPRVVPGGGASLAGYWHDQGTIVSTQAYSMHRDPEIFPNPEKFEPSRWASQTKAMKDASMPFGRGPRICIGLHLANIELRLAAARFFLKFPNARMSSLEGMRNEDMEEQIYFLLSPIGKRCLIEAC